MDLKESNEPLDKNVSIKINKKMRMWNKYKVLIMACLGLVVVIIVATVIVNVAGNNANNDTSVVNNTIADNKETHMETQTEGVKETQKETTSETKKDETETQQPTQGSQTSYAFAGKAVIEEYTSADFYADSAFLGDAIMEGVSYYRFTDSSRVVTNGGMTTDKAKDYIQTLAAANPKKIFIMLGINDINYGTRDADAIAALYSELVADIKAQIPDAKVYVLSLLPVTQAFEQKQTNQISQGAINALNEKLSQQAGEMGVTFINAADSYKNDSGYMIGECTGNGSNLNKDYYAYLLNGIAGVLK